VVIVGGGFGGLYTALALAARRLHPPILLIEPNDRFLFLPLLYELLSGELRSWEIAPRYDSLLAGKGVAWLQDRVVRIDAQSSQVHTASGRCLPFSRLVLATGGRSVVPAIEGTRLDYVFSLRELRNASAIRLFCASSERIRAAAFSQVSEASGQSPTVSKVFAIFSASFISPPSRSSTHCSLFVSISERKGQATVLSELREKTLQNNPSSSRLLRRGG
jgi:NADH dehydrogenase FAD-containing subunit